MEGQFVQKKFTIDNISFHCWVDKIGHKFWCKVHDLAVFLGYKNPYYAVRCNVPIEARKSWDELDPHIAEASIPYNWRPNTVLINKIGMKALITKAKCVRINIVKQLSNVFQLNLDVIYLTKEQSTISAIIDAFDDYECIPQFAVLSYQIDLYIPKVKLAIDCDEFGHRRHDSKFECKREQDLSE